MAETATFVSRNGNRVVVAWDCDTLAAFLRAQLQHERRIIDIGIDTASLLARADGSAVDFTLANEAATVMNRERGNECCVRA